VEDIVFSLVTDDLMNVCLVAASVASMHSPINVPPARPIKGFNKAKYHQNQASQKSDA
jgi:hypothetical protein